MTLVLCIIQFNAQERACVALFVAVEVVGCRDAFAVSIVRFKISAHVEMYHDEASHLFGSRQHARSITHSSCSQVAYLIRIITIYESNIKELASVNESLVLARLLEALLTNAFAFRCPLLAILFG